MYTQHRRVATETEITSCRTNSIQYLRLVYITNAWPIDVAFNYITSKTGAQSEFFQVEEREGESDRILNFEFTLSKQCNVDSCIFRAFLTQSIVHACVLSCLENCILRNTLYLVQ